MSGDAAQRRAALVVDRSCIVQAPAGSGKTELLIQRLLTLLPEVARPEQILAVTFTNKAAAEMRQRVLQALLRARDENPPYTEHERHTWQLARRVLDRHGPVLLRNPGRLAIQTIDSFNAGLVRRMPCLSGFGGLPEISSEPDELYRRATQQLFAVLETSLDAAGYLEVLLSHLDNQVGALQQLLCDLLQRRDQWLRHLPHVDEQVRPVLENSLAELCGSRLQALQALFPESLRPDLSDCLQTAAEQLNDNVAEHGSAELPGCEPRDLAGWQALANLLLTADGKLRKTVDKRQGFPAGEAHRAGKEQMLAVLEDLTAHPEFVAGLRQIRELPPPVYEERQWHVLHALVALLPRLVAELWLVFRETGQSDFTEIALQARQALGSSEQPSELLLQIDQDLRHILVDEFQDTSRLQFQLLEILTAGWEPDDGRTLFLVGDPMQSIYRFREAEVGLFLDCFAEERGPGGLPLQALALNSNFRSQQGLVEWLNRTFTDLFPQQADTASGAVPYTPALTINPSLTGEACQLHPFPCRDDQAEARKICELVRQVRIENPDQSIAILARGRSHLAAILPRLRQAGISYQAQDIDLLGNRPAALDVVHLTRALLHRADRLSWLAVLRAPWCGLTLADLQMAVGERLTTSVPSLLNDASRIARLSRDGQQRLRRIQPILQRALERRGRLSLRSLIEGTWLALGGPCCYPAAQHADALRVLDLLEELDRGGGVASFEELDRRLQRLFAGTDPDADGRLQIMTIHKAKGLQFDTVLIPGLGKAAAQSDNPLLRWVEHPRHGLLLAPISARYASAPDPLYRFLAGLERAQEAHEAGRLLYVAATRARRRLHLLGHVEERSSGESRPRKGSLLEKLWPQVAGFFDVVVRADSEPGEALREPSTVKLQRLPADWQTPDFASFNLARPTGSAPASDGPETAVAETSFSGWESHRQRHVGDLLHAQLEQLARQGCGETQQIGTAEQRAEFHRWLGARGLSGSVREAAVAEVIALLDQTLNSPRGRWILSGHDEGACELALTGVIDGQVRHAVIDRTFVAEGVRWVIDYKTSSPARGESRDAFLEREARRYQPQLRIYRELLRLRDERLPICSALYFPACDGWYRLTEKDG